MSVTDAFQQIKSDYTFTIQAQQLQGLSAWTEQTCLLVTLTSNGESAGQRTSQFTKIRAPLVA